MRLGTSTKIEICRIWQRPTVSVPPWRIVFKVFSHMRFWKKIQTRSHLKEHVRKSLLRLYQINIIVIPVSSTWLIYQNICSIIFYNENSQIFWNWCDACGLIILKSLIFVYDKPVHEIWSGTGLTHPKAVSFWNTFWLISQCCNKTYCFEHWIWSHQEKEKNLSLSLLKNIIMLLTNLVLLMLAWNQVMFVFHQWHWYCLQYLLLCK